MTLLEYLDKNPLVVIIFFIFGFLCLIGIEGIVVNYFLDKRTKLYLKDTKEKKKAKVTVKYDDESD